MITLQFFLALSDIVVWLFGLNTNPTNLTNYFSQRRDDSSSSLSVSLDKPLAISELLQVPSLDSLLTIVSPHLSTLRAKTLLKKLTQGAGA